MRSFLSLLLILVLLCGCVSVPPEETTAPTAPTILPTTHPTTTPTTTPTSAPASTPTSAPTTAPTVAPTSEPAAEPTDPPTIAKQFLSSLTLEEKVGQLFLARCPSKNAAQDASTYHLSGYVLFGPDFKNKTHEEVSGEIASYQAAAAVPMLIAVDEEGGSVCRVSSQRQFREVRFQSPRKLYQQGGLDLVLSTEIEKINLLQSFGINVNLAPVCDVTTDPEAFMYNRSLGESPEITGRFIAAVVELMDQKGFGCVLKHFPGYGNNTDTHVGIAVDNRRLEELESVDLVPFAAGIDAGAGAIMVSHTFINCLDREMPASLSPIVIGYLRNQMGFDGVVMTDDLVMEAITDLYGAEEAAVLAVLAGNDLLCSSEYQVQYQAVLEAVQSGRIPIEVLDAAVLRVLTWKNQLGLI